MRWLHLAIPLAFALDPTAGDLPRLSLATATAADLSFSDGPMVLTAWGAGWPHERWAREVFIREFGHFNQFVKVGKAAPRTHHAPNSRLQTHLTDLKDEFVLPLEVADEAGTLRRQVVPTAQLFKLMTKAALKGNMTRLLFTTDEENVSATSDSDPAPLTI